MITSGSLFFADLTDPRDDDVFTIPRPSGAASKWEDPGAPAPGRDAEPRRTPFVCRRGHQYHPPLSCQDCIRADADELAQAEARTGLPF